MKQRIAAAWKVLRGEYKAIPRELYPQGGLYVYGHPSNATTTTAVNVTWNRTAP